MAFLPFFAAFLEGWLLVRSVGPARGMRPRWAAVALEAILGAGAGAGLISFLYFFMLLAGVASPGLIAVVHLALLPALTGVYLRSRRSRSAGGTETVPVQPGFRWNWAIALLILACLFPVVVSTIERSIDTPHGGWDAWAIWNLRARYLAGPGDAWRNAVSPLLTRTHPDYPLLLSAFIAHNWKAAGVAFPTSIPIATTFLFGGGVVALVVSALALLRGTSLGLLAGLALLSSVSFLEDLGSQYSDVPLGLYYLGTLVLVFLSEMHGNAYRPILALGGAFASFAAWTKDEGIVFAAVVMLCVAVHEWWAGRWDRLFRRFPWFLSGALPGLLIVACFKFFLVPKVNPMVTQRPAEAAARFLTWNRWLNLFQGLWDSIADMGSGITHPFLILALLVAALGVGLPAVRRQWFMLGTVTILTVLASYCGALLVNRTLLHSRHSHPLQRMYSQLWPSFIAVAFLTVRSLEEWNPARAESARKGVKKRA